MDKNEFVVGLIGEIIWPLSLFIILFILRKPIKGLLPLLKKAKIKEFEFEFERDMAKIKVIAEEEFQGQSNDWKSSLLHLAHDMPSSSILEAWKEVEDKAEKLIKLRNSEIDLDVPKRYKLMQDTMADEDIIDTKKIKIFNELRQIRNKVAHVEDYKISKEQALNYISIAIKLIDYFDEESKLT